MLHTISQLGLSRSLAAWLLAAATTAGCGGGRGLSGSSASGGAIAPAVAEAPLPAAGAPPVAVPLGAGPPSWLETPPQKPYDDSDADLPLAEPEDIAIGKAAALVKSSRGQLFLVGAGAGYAGLVRPPDAPAWLGLDLRDRLYAATADGALYSAAGAGEPFERTSTVPGAIAWDAVDLLVATDGSQVYVSSDRGRSFQPHRPTREAGASIARVLTRADGVVVAVGQTADGPAAWISRDRGRRWKPSVYRPKSLVRDGATIWNGDWSCPASLSSDGASWAPLAADSRAGWAGMVQVSEDVEPMPRDYARATATSPAAPSPPRRDSAVKGLGDCTATHGDGGGSGAGYGLQLECHGVGCLRGRVDSVIAATHTDFGLLRDAACDRADPQIPEGYRCAADAALVRVPHAAVQDRDAGTVSIVDLPASCSAPLHLRGARGIGVLTCRNPDLERDGVGVFALDRDGGWHAEGTLPAAAASVWAATMADDGTLLFHASCKPGAPCVAFVRSPDAPGSTAAWSTAAVPGAIAYRVVPGAALAAVPVAAAGAAGSADAAGASGSSATPSRLRLVRAAAGNATVLVDGVYIDGDLTSLRIDHEGRIVLGLSDGEQHSYAWVRPDGSLVAGAGAPASRVDPSGAIVVEPTPIDPALY